MLVAVADDCTHKTGSVVASGNKSKPAALLQAPCLPSAQRAACPLPGQGLIGYLTGVRRDVICADMYAWRVCQMLLKYADFLRTCGRLKAIRPISVTAPRLGDTCTVGIAVQHSAAALIK